MTHYFIDTENVGKRMSDLTDSLQTGDIIHMFYTDLNAGMNVTMRMLGAITQAGARVETIYCVCGSPNALDFQLVSFLSSMLNKKDKFVIYAYDTGYDAVCQFWSNRGIKISRIAPKLDESASDQPKPASQPSERSETAVKLTKEYIQEILKRHGFNGDTMKRTALIFTHTLNLPKQGRMLQLQNQMRQAFGAKRGQELYKKVKPVFQTILTNKPEDLP